MSDTRTPSKFLAAYIEAALWSTNDESDDETGGDPLDKNYSPSDISDETYAKMAADCERFQTENAAMLERYAEELPGTEWSTDEQAGHDFWLSRNGHGAGFFDRDASKEVTNALQEAARAFGTVDLYVGDDGEIYA